MRVAQIWNCRSALRGRERRCGCLSCGNSNCCRQHRSSATSSALGLRRESEPSLSQPERADLVFYSESRAVGVGAKKRFRGIVPCAAVQSVPKIQQRAKPLPWPNLQTLATSAHASRLVWRRARGNRLTSWTLEPASNLEMLHKSIGGGVNWFHI